jgi:hypothetical protein
LKEHAKLDDDEGCEEEKHSRRRHWYVKTPFRVCVLQTAISMANHAFDGSMEKKMAKHLLSQKGVIIPFDGRCDQVLRKQNRDDHLDYSGQREILYDHDGDNEDAGEDLETTITDDDGDTPSAGTSSGTLASSWGALDPNSAMRLSGLTQSIVAGDSDYVEPLKDFDWKQFPDLRATADALWEWIIDAAQGRAGAQEILRYEREIFFSTSSFEEKLANLRSKVIASKLNLTIGQVNNIHHQNKIKPEMRNTRGALTQFLSTLRDFGEPVGRCAK